MLSKFNITGTSENNTELLTVRVKDDVRMVSQDHINWFFIKGMIVRDKITIHPVGIAIANEIKCRAFVHT